ncbi:EboA domain-containing protein [Streptomyces sp. LHD-70]|uniref:EboA domain-containing protein n=1 Tax=Streptomyces sp. LHD-70 TaxID=3072140 RepID=UPI00280F0BE9|nr:EboA domain-containing protein [Streptomyces sp. LHD-70]MDQ8706312.1 EboA domain-containing protein [Streptomyces sp. LHD-70]
MTDTSSALRAALDDPARAWFDKALEQATAHAKSSTGKPSDASADPQGPPPLWELRFAEAGRRCGAAHADAARLLLLQAAQSDLATVTRLYQQGTADERRAVLLSLPHLVQGPQALPLTEDALRTNDPRLVAAAVGPYAGEHLDRHAWRHAILKCLFIGVPVATVARLRVRARGDAELARMLGDYAAERSAAGRPVPDDLHRVLGLTQPPVEGEGEGEGVSGGAGAGKELAGPTGPAASSESATPTECAEPAASSAPAAPTEPAPAESDEDVSRAPRVSRKES